MVGYGLQCHSSTPGVFPDQLMLLHLALLLMLMSIFKQEMKERFNVNDDNAKLKLLL